MTTPKRRTEEDSIGLINRPVLGDSRESLEHRVFLGTFYSTPVVNHLDLTLVLKAVKASLSKVRRKLGNRPISLDGRSDFAHTGSGSGRLLAAGNSFYERTRLALTVLYLSSLPIQSM